VEGLAPGVLEAGAGQHPVPVVFDDVVARLLGLIRERREQLVGRLAAEEWRDERLQDRDGAVVRARVAPGLERVRRRDVPVAEARGLVVVEAEVDAQIDLAERLHEAEVRGRREDRVAPNDDERRDLARVHVLDERLKRSRLVRRAAGNRRRVGDGVPGIAKHLVDRVRDRVHGGRLRFARHHQAPARVRLQVRCNCLDERIRGGGRGDGADRDGERVRKGFDLGRRHRPPMVGARARQRRRGLDGVEAVGALGLAARGEVADVARHGRARSEEVGLERHDDVGLVEGVPRLDHLAERQQRAAGDVVSPDGLPRDPLRGRERGEHVADLLLERRGGDGARQEPDPRAAIRALLLDGELRRGEKRAPRPDLPALGQGLRAVRVVDVEDRGLREDVRAAEARRVQLVALDLDRPALVALGEDAARVSAVDVRGRVEERLAGDELLGRLDVREDPLGRLPRAARQPRERDGGAHQGQQLAPVHARLDRHAELAVQVLAEVLGLEQLLEAAPVLAPPKLAELRPGLLDADALAAHRWHVVQSVNSNVGRMWYSAFSRSPISSWIPAGT
jgi:hypothetical protein